MSSLVAQVEKRAVLEEKAKEVAYVRGEKVADDKAYQKLQAAYGGGAHQHKDEVRKRIWTCVECNFRNVDTRDVCGSCLAPNPAVISNAKKARNDLIPARGSVDQTNRIFNVGGRCYREFVQLQVGKITSRRPAPPQQGTSTSQRRANGDDDNDDGEDDDEPGCCRVDDSGAATYDDGTQQHYYPGDRGDDDDDDDDGVGDGEEDEDGVAYDRQRQSYVLKMNVPARYFKFIIGAKGKTLQEIQRTTGATVLLPNTDKNTANVKDKNKDTAEITGPNKTCIQAARIRIDGIILDNQDRVDYTHFLSIPLAASPSSRAVFASFLHDMVRTCVDEERRIDPFMFQSPAKVHLTLLMLRLHTPDEVERARSLLVVVQEMLREMFPSASSSAGDKNSNSNKISFSGCNYMNDDPTEVHVVYLELVRDAASRKLVDLIERINELFIDSGLALPKDVTHNQKLHATLINSKWRGGVISDATVENVAHSESSTVRAHGPRLAFDATEVLRLFGDWNQLGSHKMERVDLSVLGGGGGGVVGCSTVMAASDGYFPREGSAYFP